MASLVNRYFHQTRTDEQYLLNSLVKESIQIMGLTYWYLPRDVQLDDLIFGEDIISKFPIAIPIEMYMENATGFDGDKEMFSKFGLELRNAYKLVIHKERWEEEVLHQFVKYSEDNSNPLFRAANYLRPREGDLIYDPLTKFLMEIKFVDHDAEFFSLGKNYKYHLSCEAFSYQNEEITTGVVEIDLFQSNSRDTLFDQILLESGDSILLEQYGTLILENGEALVQSRQYGTNFEQDANIIKVNITNPFA